MIEEYRFSIAFRPQFVIREAFASYLQDVLRQTTRRNPGSKADALDAGEIGFQVQALSEDPPFITSDLIRSVEKSSPTEKDLFVSFKPVSDLAPDFVARENRIPASPEHLRRISHNRRLMW